MSEILRLELAPFGVTVVTGMIGNVQTNFHSNDTWSGLSDDSMYSSMEPYIQRFAEGKYSLKKEPREDFARRFVNDILGGKSGQVWRGTNALTGRVVGYHAPAAVLVSDDQYFRFPKAILSS